MAKKRRHQLTKREYERLKQAAWKYCVEQGMEQKDVAKLLGITEATLSNWSSSDPRGSFKEQRTARQQCQSTEADNIRKLIQVLSKQRLELESFIADAIKNGDSKAEADLRRRAAALSDEMSKQNKVLLSLDKATYTLGVFIDVMDEIFNTMRVQDEELWEKTLSFQSTITRKKIQELG